MGILVQLEADAKPDCLEQLLAMIKQRFPETRAFNGCNGITAYLNEDKHTLIFVEHWDSKEHYQEYYDWRDRTGVLTELGALLQSPPNIRYFELVDA